MLRIERHIEPGVAERNNQCMGRLTATNNMWLGLSILTIDFTLLATETVVGLSAAPPPTTTFFFVDRIITFLYHKQAGRLVSWQTARVGPSPSGCVQSNPMNRPLW